MVKKTDSVHLEQVAPGLAPGRVWVRICAGEELITEEPLDDLELVGQLAEKHATAALAYLKRGYSVRAYFYDGDSGECKATMVTEPPWRGSPYEQRN